MMQLQKYLKKKKGGDGEEDPHFHLPGRDNQGQHRHHHRIRKYAKEDKQRQMDADYFNSLPEDERKRELGINN